MRTPTTRATTARIGRLLFVASAPLALLECRLDKVSTLVSSGPEMIDNTSTMQNETMMVTARRGPTLQGDDALSRVVTVFNDLSIAQLSGGPEAGTGFVRRGRSLFGWAVTDNGSQWNYRGKVRPPVGWAGIAGDPSIAVDQQQPNLVYAAYMGISDESFDRSSTDGDTSPGSSVDGFCIARSFNGGFDFGTCLDSTCESTADLTTYVAHCHRAAPIAEVPTDTGRFDLTQVAVDWFGRVWVAMEDRVTGRIALWRNRDDRSGWSDFFQIAVCGEPGDQTDCIPTEALSTLGGRRPLLRTEEPCDPALSIDCLQAPQGGSGIFLLSKQIVELPTTFRNEYRVLGFGHVQTGEHLSCLEGADCLSGNCLTAGGCTCATDSDCGSGGVCDLSLGLCVDECGLDTECLSGHCESVGFCECLDDSQCPASQQCSGGLCFTRACMSDAECPEGFRCPLAGDPEIANGLLENTCAQVPSWQGVNLDEFCQLGQGDRPEPWTLGDGSPVVGYGPVITDVRTMLASFDVGTVELGQSATMRFAYAHLGPRPDPFPGQALSRLQVAELTAIPTPDGFSEFVCLVHPLATTDSAIALFGNARRQEFQPVLRFAHRLRNMPDPTQSPVQVITSRWDFGFLSTHAAVDDQELYIAQADARLIATPSAIAGAGDLTIGDVLVIPGGHLNYMCADSTPFIPQPGVPIAPGMAAFFGFWGDYYDSTRMFGQLRVHTSDQSDGTPNYWDGAQPMWAKISAFPAGVRRDLGDPSPCNGQTLPFAGPQHIESHLRITDVLDFAAQDFTQVP